MEKAVQEWQPSRLGAFVRKIIWLTYTNDTKKNDAVDLVAGVPEPSFSILDERVREYVQSIGTDDWVNLHQYSRPFGILKLVKAVASYYNELDVRRSVEVPRKISPETEILVTVGAFQALYLTILGWIKPGDEVIFFEPAFNGYFNLIELAEGVPVPVQLDYCLDVDVEDITSNEAFKFNAEATRSKITKKTKMIILNNPHNPSGKVYSLEELQEIAKLAEEFNLIVVSDEVYEFHVYKPELMIRFATLKGMWERTITIGSGGKAFNSTGWRVGWAIAKEQLLKPLKNIHASSTFCVPYITQEIMARQFEEELRILKSDKPEESYFNKIIEEIKKLKGPLAKVFRDKNYRIIEPDSGYFFLADFSFARLPKDWLEPPATKRRRLDVPEGQSSSSYKLFLLTSAEVYRFLCFDRKIGVIPADAFYSTDKKTDKFIRICFYRKQEVLDKAMDNLKPIMI